jgi:hypothetical protein
MLNQQDRARLTQDAFDTNLKGMLGESLAQSLHLKTQLDIAQMELGVARDLIAAKDKEITQKDDDLTKTRQERDALALRIVAQTRPRSKR